MSNFDTKAARDALAEATFWTDIGQPFNAMFEATAVLALIRCVVREETAAAKTHAPAPSIPNPLKGGEAHSQDQRSSPWPDKTPPAIGDVPVAGDVARQLAEHLERALFWDSTPRSIPRDVKEAMLETLAAYRKETDNGA